MDTDHPPVNAKQEAQNALLYRIWQAEKEKFVKVCFADRIAKQKLEKVNTEREELSKAKEASLLQLREIEEKLASLLQVEELEKEEVEKNAQLQELGLEAFKLEWMRKSIKAIADDEFKDALEWCKQSKECGQSLVADESFSTR